MVRRSSSSDGGQRVSIVNYDGQRLISSPASLEACRLEGILPEALLVQRPLPVADDPYSACHCKSDEEVQLKRDFIEQRRKALIRTVEMTRFKILSTKPSVGGKLPAIHSKNLPEDAGSPPVAVQPVPATAPAGSPVRKKYSPQPQFHEVTLPEGTHDVAHYFMMLKNEAERRAALFAKWQRKQRLLEERHKMVEARRTEKAQALATARDVRLQTTLKRAANLDEERVHTAEEKAAKLDSLLNTITERRTALRSRSRPRPTVTKEQLAAAKIEEDRLATIKSKLETAEKSSMEHQTKTRHKRELAAFILELQGCAHKDLTQRAERAKSYRAYVVESSIDEVASRRREAELERQRRLLQRSLLREVIHRQKAEIAEHVSKQGIGTAPVQPPPWLESQLAALNEKNKPLTARGPRPPNSPRAGPSTARSRTFAVQEPFTYGSSKDPSPKQAFASWMYQSY